MAITNQRIQIKRHLDINVSCVVNLFPLIPTNLLLTRKSQKSFIGDKEKQIETLIGNIDGKIVYSFANRNLNEIKLYDFTIAEI